MNFQFAHAAILASQCLWPVGPLPSEDPIDPQKFAEQHALIKPKPEESAWEQIPWLVSLWEARQRAAVEGKPILLWEMDGHPLGCT